jgi:hypothetical protein
MTKDEYKQLYEQVCEQYDVLAKVLSDAVAESRLEVAAKDEALDLALEALKLYSSEHAKRYGLEGAYDEEKTKGDLAITAIKQARSAPVQEPDWSHAWLLIKAASYASSQGHISGTTNWGAAMSAYLRHESKAAAQPAPVQEPEYWDVIDPAGNIVASETDAIRGWARIAGSYKPTVEGLLGFHDQGWRVLPKVTPPAAKRQWTGLTDEEIESLDCVYLSWLDYEEVEIKGEKEFARAIEAKLKEKNT